MFASAAAVGAGLSVAVDHVTGAAPVPARVAGYAVAVPVAVYLLSVRALHWERHRRGLAPLAVPVAAVLVLALPLVPATLPLIALVLAGLVATSPGRPVGHR